MVAVLALAVLILVVVLVWTLYLNLSLPKNFPPGPRSWPIWGGYYQILLENLQLPQRAIHDMSKRYKTTVVGTRFGTLPTVIACDWDTVNDVLTRPEFQGRVYTFFPKFRSDGDRHGIIFTEGDKWQEQRRYMLRNLRDFGFGKRSDKLEEVLGEEVKDLIELLKDGKQPFSKDGRAFVPELFYALSANMAFHIYSGDRKSPEEAHNFAKMMMLQNKRIETTTGALNMSPWMRFFTPEAIGFTATKLATRYAQKLIQGMIKEHKDNLTDETSNDFIDRYIQEMRKKKEEPYTTFSEPQLQVIGMDVLFAASTTIPIAMGFILILAAKYPEVQRKCQEEIDNVVGRNRPPSLSDRINLAYNEAMIRESLRYQTMVPLGVPHKATEDTTLGGYFIPKGALVLTSLYSAHRDPKVWEEPDMFKPERFIGPDGKIAKKDLSRPFGLGKRVCAGETFARQNLFIIATSMLQNFTFTESAEHPLPDFSENLPGLNESTKPYWINVTPRY